nr:uncharacterized protein LOC117600634 isoform X2 [Osmia lignaria]
MNVNMFNIKYQQISDSGENVSSLLNIEQAIECLNSWGDWTGSEQWLTSTAEELSKRYRELRKDIRENINSQYCERLAYHYYNLASYCNDELFNKYRVNLESVKKYLEKCLEKLTEVSQDGYSNEIKELKNDAEKFLAEVNEIYTQQESQLTQYRASNMKKYIKLCIVLGHIDHIPLQQCSDEKNRQQIQNIQLLRVINMLEDAITVPVYKNAFVTAEQSDYLGQVYQLAGQSALGMRYKRTSDNLKKTVYLMEQHNDNRQEIKNIISKEITKYKSDLGQVKSYIEEKFHKSLSTIDDAYIEKKYIKYCARFWLEETTNFLKTLTESKSRTVIQEIFNSLDDIKGLSQIPKPLNVLEYYTLLMEHYRLVRKEDEKTFISRFKKECLEQIVAYSDSAKKELVLLETFVNFLSFSKSLQSIVAELELEDFYRGYLSFDELIDNIMKLEVDIYGENLTVLQEATEGLKEEDLFLIDKFKEVIGAYIKPVRIQERRIDDRLVVEVTGKNIVVSEILQLLENTLLENPNIEEVRFVGADIIHIDTNLKSKVWQGRNVVILTKAIKVHDQVTWDVSGKDNDHIYSHSAGTGQDGHGKQGKDGYPGESGGNVLIIAEKIENPEDFTIISNGGRGGKGQDGGNGRDGNNGMGITKAEFDKKFPPVADFGSGAAQRQDTIKKFVENIKNDSSTVETVWCTGANIATIENIITEIADINSYNDTVFEMADGDTSLYLFKHFEENIFIKTVTSQGNEVTFSFERGGGLTNRQAFFLYKGSLGQPGWHGGEYGLGGQGGYAGEIIVKNLENSSQECGIMKNTNQGQEGEKGQGGLYGIHGKNGWDMGYMDYWVSEFFTEKWPKFFGTDQSSKCTLEYYDNNSSDRVWCPYNKKYAKIISTNIEHKKQKKYEERKNTRQNSARQHHAQAIRKKNISQSSILASYSHHLSSMERNTLQNLRSDLENTKQQALQAITENQEQQEKQTTELGIKRHSPYQNKSNHYNDIFITTSSTTYRETIDVESFIDKLKKEPLLLDNWFQLIELSLSQLDQLFLIFEGLKSRYTETQSLQDNTENSKLQDIEKLLIDKYTLATLQEIAKQLPPYQEVTDGIEITPKTAARYLIEAKENDNDVSHPILGTLNQYFYERNEQHHNEIFKLCEEELQNSNENCEILKRSLKTFILEAGESEGVHSSIKKYYNEHKEFLEKQKPSLNISFEAFKSELSQPRHAEVFGLWIESIKDQSLRSKLEEKIQKDNILNDLYDRFNSQLKQEYDWNECCKDQAVLKEHDNYIREKGLLSESYRELLAYVFGINIRLYVEDQDNKLFLQGDHNPSSKQIIHILCRDNKFIQLNIDKNYLKLEEEHKKKDDLYAQIFAEIKPLKQKQEFDDYLKNKTFLSNNSPSEDEQSFNEEEDIEKIVEYFPEVERQQLKGRLDKITPQYIGQQGILHNILKRFSSDGRYVSSQELYCLINSILSSVIEDKKELNIFCWIVAAYPQKSWIDELILLQLENYFKKTLTKKPEWRNYLSKIENKDILLLFTIKLDQYKSSNPISTQCIEDTLHLLSNIPNETVSLERLELSEWPYALKEKYWTCKLSKLVDWQKGDLPTASYYLLSIENIFGMLLAEKFIEALEKKKQELSSDTLTNILSNFHNEKWNLSEEELNTLNSCSIDEWAQQMQQKFTANKEERKITQLVELIKCNANTSKEILNKLSKIKNYIESIDKHIIAGKPIGSFTEYDIENWVKEFQGSIGDIKETHKEILAVIDRAIELKRGFQLRDTQRLTVLALLTNNRSTLAQVSTGEGKSLIVVAASIMKALCGGKVDIITSSSVLAKRDAEGNRDIYNLFSINVSHNCSEDIENRKEAYSSNQVVYGDLSNFQRDYLLDKFYGKNILGDRNFENLIVDEVDSMLLDKGNNMLYLSHDLAGFDKLESVYIYIWQWINKPARNREELSYAFDTKTIKEAVLNDLYGLMKKEDISKLGSELGEQQKNIMWERLIKAEILDNQGKLLKGNINDNELNKILSPEFNCYKDRLHYLLNECIEREKFIRVPNNFRPFIEQHLESWINSAITAFCMKAGEDYVVDVDKTGTSPDLNPNITILDRDTGTDQTNSQWDEALHQFLQLKHGCKLSLQSLKAVFISNVSFFKLYSNLYGLTGTLGSQRERDLLQEIHGVDFVTVPTAKSKQFHEDKPILCTGKEEWINRIRNEAKKLTEENERSVLIICETVNDVEILYKAFGGKNVKHVYTYTRDYEEFDKGFEIVQGNKELGQGQIIIATNLAGRGTDIKITKELRSKGGLHVCLTYLSNNIRIEQQAFGRAARSGDKGSGQLIIMDSKGQEYSNLKVLDLKKGRDTEELHRISDIKAYYETQITTEENCFKSFKEQYEQLEKDLDDKKVPTEVKKILLQSCLDKWAFWLDEHNKYVRDLTDEQDKKNLHNLLDKFISKLKNLETGYSEKWISSPGGHCTLIIEYNSKSWLAWVEGNPIQMIKLGKYLSQNEEYKNAIELFDEVIKKELYFSEAARYYKAFALVKKVDWEKEPLKEEDEKLLKEFKQELREAARLLDEHSKFAINAASIIGKIKKNNNESILQIDAYEEQQKSLASLYYMFSRSIDDIFGHTITPQSFVNSDIKEELAESLYKDLLEKNILEKPRVEENIAEEELKVITSSYGVSDKELKGFLSKYKGKEINEREFQKSLTKDIKLPDRKAFWKLLIQGEVLSDEVKCVVVNNGKLKEIDPSLLDDLTGKINQRELEKQTLEISNEQILLNTEWVTQQKNNGNILKKDDFITIVGKGKYKALKERGVLSFNRKAHIDPSKIESMTFPCYDSITLEDFTKANITKSEAEKILAELIKQNVVEKKDNSKNSAYGLKIKFDELQQGQLSFCSVYENVVKGLLSTCFIYRIALQRIVKHLKEKNFPVRLQLINKPHQNLASELLEQKVIRPVTVTTEDEDLEDKLKGIYSRTITKVNFKCILSQSKLIPEECIEELFDFLVEKGWIIKYEPTQSIRDEGITAIGKEDIKNAGKSLVQDLYYINSPDKRQKPLSFSSKDLQSIDKTVEKILDNQLQLAKKDTIQNIVNTLKRSRSLLKTLKIPDGKLKPITEPCEFANIQEVYVFSLNGLDQLLQLEEMKWTQEMLFNTAIVTAMGVCQIVIGTAIELYSVGMMTHVGAAFVNEGVNDLFYAAGALKSGYFSWKDYKQQKLQSLMVTAVTVGVGAYLSRGAKVSRFGHKLAGPNFEFGKKVAEMSGTQLIETVGSKVVNGVVKTSLASGWKIVGKEVAKRIILKTIEGVAFGLANAGIDRLVENYLQALCEGIASDILSDIEREVEEHNISINLKEAYKVLGRENAKKLIDDLTRSVFTRQSYVEEFLPIASKIVSSVTQGIGEAIKKRSKTSNKLELPISAISKVVVWLERSAQIANITMITNNLLNNLDQEIKGRLNKLEKDVERNQKQEVEKNYESFKKEVIDQWKSLLREKAGQIIARHIVSPVLKENANHLVRYAGKKVQEAYQSYKESGYFKCFEELKQEYKEKLQNEQQCDNTSKTKNRITKKYHKDLQKLMIKTRNPDLFAAIIKENIPMDMVCVSACAQVVQTILKEQGVVIPGLTVIVEGDGGIRQEFSSMSEGAERTIIKFGLKDNHFTFCGSNTSENNRSSESKNNCLCEAFLEAIPGLKDIISPEELRTKAAHFIKHDNEIRHHIQQGWHRLPTSLGAFGGKRSIPVPTSRLNEQAENQSPYQHSNSRGEWKFDKNKDIDLRENRVLTNKESHLQLTKGYNEALNKINQALSSVNKKPISVDPSSFKATKYDAILCNSGEFGKIGIALYPVEMEATVEGPHGPHIGYEVIPHNKQAPKGITGHILINQVENERLPDRGRSQYTDNSKKPKIPTTRLFFPPNRPNTYLERDETGNEGADSRGRSYPTTDF